MSRWYVEKDGTGIEKSGTGIEKSGTGIEKSGTGIEKSGTGIRKGILACSLAAMAFASHVSAAGNLDPAGALQLVVDDETVAVSWIIDGSVFSGVTSVRGTIVNLELTELALAKAVLPTTDTTGGGSGNKTNTTGGGTGSSTETTGGGTGSNIETTGGGTGMETTGGGTGSSTDTTGGGTGTTIQGFIGDQFVLTTGGGTGAETVSITLPAGTGLMMEVTLGCETASVSVIDANFAEVVTFQNVPIIGSTGFCANDDSGGFDGNRLPGKFRDGLK